jgi:hypothetical protein
MGFFVFPSYYLKTFTITDIPDKILNEEIALLLSEPSIEILTGMRWVT